MLRVFFKEVIRLGFLDRSGLLSFGFFFNRDGMFKRSCFLFFVCLFNWILLLLPIIFL